MYVEVIASQSSVVFWDMVCIYFRYYIIAALLSIDCGYVKLVFFKKFYGFLYIILLNV